MLLSERILFEIKARVVNPYMQTYMRVDCLHCNKLSSFLLNMHRKSYQQMSIFQIRVRLFFEIYYACVSV